jgi:ABC-2 type transport system permease protein
MNLSRTLAVARKETWQIVRDSRALYLALGIPLMFLFLFGYALSLDVDNIPTVVWDQDQTPASREFIDRMTSSGYFTLKRRVSTYREILQGLDTNEISVGLVIPHDFSRNLAKGNVSHLQIVVDGSDSTRAGLAIVYIETITAIFEADFRLKALDRQAVTSMVRQPVEGRIRLLYNPEMVSRNNIIPGLISMIMMVMAALLTSLTIVRERETGTMEQLISTPIKPGELIVGKLVPYFVLGYVDLLMVYIAGQYVFEVPFRGSLLIMFVMSGVFLIGALSLGFLISVGAENQFIATQIALLGTFLPSFLLSGFVYPIYNMPTWLQWITFIVPARHYIQILRGVYLKGAGWEAIAFPAVVLVIFGIAITVAASRKLGTRLE